MLCECGEIKKTIDDVEREENDERDRDIKVRRRKSATDDQHL
jgi:hypothetical protein